MSLHVTYRAYNNGGNMNWPNYYPENCPPDDAEKPSGLVFRFTYKAKSSRADFKPYHREGKEWKNDCQTCQACGISVYTDLNEVLRVQKRTPAARNKFIARYEVNENDGLIKNTPGNSPNHHTWWIVEGNQVWERFENIAPPLRKS